MAKKQTEQRTTVVTRITTDAERKGMSRPDVYDEFILWMGMPPLEKVKLGLETQKDFCELYGIEKTTPSRWKKRHDFRPRVDDLRHEWAYEKTQDVLQGMYQSACKGNPMSQLLWLQYFAKFNPKQEAEKAANKIEIGVNDIRHLIEQLPEPLKSKHYANLRDLLDDSSAFANAIEVEGGTWTERTPQPLPGETDHDAQDVPDAGTNALASCHQIGVRADMVREVSACHHQGASWWWQEQAPGYTGI